MNIDGRLRFFFGLVLILLFNYFLYQIFFSIWEQLTLSEVTATYGIWILYGLITLSAVFFGTFVYNKIFNKSTEQIEDRYSFDLFHSYSLSTSSVPFKEQLIIGLLLLTLVYAPLDFISYCIPGLYEYQEAQILIVKYTSYLKWSFPSMLGATIVIHFFVALREESFFRGAFIEIGKKNLSKSEVMIYSIVLFGLVHFSYIFSPIAKDYSYFYPLWWGINAAIISICATYVLLEKKSIWPIIFAHWANNVVSATVTKFFMEGHTLIYSFVRIYLGIFILGLILLYYKRESLKHHIHNLTLLLRGYFKPSLLKENKEGENLPEHTNRREKEQARQGTSSRREKKKMKRKTAKKETLALQKESLKTGESDEETFQRIILDLILILLLWIFSLLLF